MESCWKIEQSLDLAWGNKDRVRCWGVVAKDKKEGMSF
jgi:hypothetical protein